MPVYEYECSECGHHMEVWQKISDSPIEVCEQCNGKVKKILSQTTFHLKGSGWYVTDYGSRKTQCGSPSSAPSKVESATPKAPKQESKASESGPKPTGGDSKS